MNPKQHGLNPGRACRLSIKVEFNAPDSLFHGENDVDDRVFVGRIVHDDGHSSSSSWQEHITPLI